MMFFFVLLTLYTGYVTRSSNSLSASARGYGPPTGAGVDLNNTEPLYVDTNAEAIPYVQSAQIILNIIYKQYIYK